jgi:hypothetical protein
MTKTISSGAIASEIEKLRADLRNVNAAIEVIGKPAMQKATELEHAIAKAQERYATALANEAAAARTARLAAFSDISVEVRHGDKREPNLLKATVIIRYTKDAYDARYRQAFPKEHSCNGFMALPDDAYEYLVWVKPEAIPAEIMELAPGDPHAAFRAYFTGLRRGCFRTAARVDALPSHHPCAVA